jgi:hypothetical protein
LAISDSAAEKAKSDRVEPTRGGDLNDSASKVLPPEKELKPGTPKGVDPEEQGGVGAEEPLRSPSASPDRLQPPPTPPTAKEFKSPEKETKTFEPPKTPVGAGSSGDLDLFAKPKGISLAISNDIWHNF